MPIVPRSVQPIADPTPYQEQVAHYTPGAFGRGQGRAIAGIGQEMERSANVATGIYLKQLTEDNERMAKELDTEFTSRKRELLYGENGYYNKQGTNAINEAPAYKKQLLALQKEIAGRSQNDQVKQMLEPVLANRMNNELESFDRYTNKERINANNLASQARIKEAIDDAALQWNNPKALEQAEILAKNEVISMGEQNGWSPEVIQSKVEEATTGVYFGAINMAINQGQTRAAKDMYAKYGSKLDAPESQKLVKEFRQEDRMAAAEARALRAEQRSIIAWNQSQEDRNRRLKDRIDAEYNRDLSQEIVDQFHDLGLTYAEAQNEIDKITDVDLRDEVKKRAQNEYARQETERKIATEEASREAFQALRNGSTVDDVLESLGDRAEYLTQDDNVIERMNRIETLVAEDNLYAKSSDNKTLIDTLRKPASELAKVDPNTYLGKLTKGEMGKLTTAVVNANKSLNEEKDISGKLVDGAEQDLNRDLRGNPIYFDGATPTPEYHRVINDLRDWVYGYVEQSGGKAPSDKEVKQKAAQLSTTYENDRYFGLSTFQANERNLTPEQRLTARIPMASIPTSLLTQISNALTQAGVDPKSLDDSVFEEMAAAFMLNQEERWNEIIKANK